MKLIGEDVAIDLAFLPIGEHFVGNMFGDILSDETAMLSGSIACSVQPRWTRTAKGRSTSDREAFTEGQSRLLQAFAGCLRRRVHEDLNRQGMMDHVGAMMWIVLRRLLSPLLVFGPGC